MSTGYSGTDMGMSGISTLTFSADCHVTEQQKSAVRNILSGTRIYFSAISSPQLYLTSYNLNGNVLSITASDKLADADITFTADGTNFVEYSTTKDANGDYIKNIYHAQDVLDACAGKLGLGSCAVSGVPDLYYSEFVGKTIREVITNISAAAVGVFYARGSLEFAPYRLPQGQSRSVITVSPADRSTVEFLGSKNITHAYITDNVYAETYEYGSGTWYYTVSLSGAYMIGETVCDAVAGKITGTTYTGWKCDNAIEDTLPTPNTELGQGSGYLIRECTLKFGAVNIIAFYGSPAPAINKADFQDEKTRMLKQKIEVGKTYANVFIDQNSGLTVQYEEVSV